MQAPSLPLPPLPPEFRVQPKTEFSNQLYELEAAIYEAVERFQNASHAEVLGISTRCEHSAAIDGTLLLRKIIVIETQPEGVWAKPQASHLP